MATLKDVASAAGVSLGTASKVLAGRAGVSEARRRQVEAAAAGLGYRRNSLAADLRSHRSTTIGFVVPDLTNSFFIELACALENYALGSGYRLMLAHAQEDPDREAERLAFVLSRQMAGMIIIPCRGHEYATDELRRWNVPVVMADRVDERLPVDTVTTDSRRACREGTEHLLELGHRRIAFLVNTLELVNSRERADGYRDAMRRAGLAKAASVIECGMTSAAIHARVLALLGARTRPTALFTGTNVATLGALRAIRDADLSLPRDVSLLSFDDAPWMSALRPGISSIRQPVEAIGHAIWQRLVRLLDGEGGPVQHLRFRAELIARDSTAPLRPRRKEVAAA